MDLNKKTIIENCLQRISNALLLNANFTDNLGLLNGKMGIALFFYQYAGFTKSEIYKRYAGELIDEICEEISLATPIDFANGLTGIGWGIEYLVQNGFVETNTDEALEEIDDAIFRATMQTDVSIHNLKSLSGFGFYYLARLKGKELNDENPRILKIKQMLIYMLEEYDQLLKKEIKIETKILELTFSQINFLLWFILEAKKLELQPEKNHNLIQQLVLYLNKKKINISDPIEITIFNYLTNEWKNLISEIRTKFENLTFNILNGYTTENENVDQIVSNHIKLGWNQMIYNIEFNCLKQDIPEKDFVIVTNSENLSIRLERLNRTHLGLDNGIAGLGMAGLGMALLHYK